MKPRTVVLVGVVVLSASAASAQFIPRGASIDSISEDGDVVLSVYAEGRSKDVVVEHMVSRAPDSDFGFRFGDGGFQAGGKRFSSAEQFLQHVWYQSIEREEQWFYARQTVVYSSLSEAAEQRWEYNHPPIACMVLVDESGAKVGAQVRTKAWSLYTDHWVLYPRYRAPTEWRPNQVSFKDVSDDGCFWPGELVEDEFKQASRLRNLESYRYATATYAVVPLERDDATIMDLSRPGALELSPRFR